RRPGRLLLPGGRRHPRDPDRYRDEPAAPRPPGAEEGARRERGGCLMSTQIHCLEAEQRLQAYVDHALTPEEVAAIEAHLAVCAPCARCYRLPHHQGTTLHT